MKCVAIRAALVLALLVLPFTGCDCFKTSNGTSTATKSDNMDRLKSTKPADRAKAADDAGNRLGPK